MIFGRQKKIGFFYKNHKKQKPNLCIYSHYKFLFAYKPKYLKIMVLTKEDRILIQNLHEFKGYGARKMIKKFPQKRWKLSSLSYLLRRLRETGSADRQAGSGRRNTHVHKKILMLSVN